MDQRQRWVLQIRRVERRNTVRLTPKKTRSVPATKSISMSLTPLKNSNRYEIDDAANIAKELRVTPGVPHLPIPGKGKTARCHGPIFLLSSNSYQRLP